MVRAFERRSDEYQQALEKAKTRLVAQKKRCRSKEADAEIITSAKENELEVLKDLRRRAALIRVKESKGGEGKRGLPSANKAADRYPEGITSTTSTCPVKGRGVSSILSDADITNKSAAAYLVDGNYSSGVPTPVTTTTMCPANAVTPATGEEKEESKRVVPDIIKLHVHNSRKGSAISVSKTDPGWNFTSHSNGTATVATVALGIDSDAKSAIAPQMSS
eukprot:jgi/Bigna1/68147/fgenesh1_pg.5_\